MELDLFFCKKSLNKDRPAKDNTYAKTNGAFLEAVRRTIEFMLFFGDKEPRVCDCKYTNKSINKAFVSSKNVF
jgi:hypothetical protein